MCGYRLHSVAIVGRHTRITSIQQKHVSIHYLMLLESIPSHLCKTKTQNIAMKDAGIVQGLVDCHVCNHQF